jgi:hypothetical protein
VQFSVSANEPEIVRDADRGDVFICHTPALCESIVARVWFAPGDGGAPLLVTSNNGDEGELVVIGSRVGPDDPAYLTPGLIVRVHLDSPITRLEQVERIPLRARGTRKTLALGPTAYLDDLLPAHAQQLVDGACTFVEQINAFTEFTAAYADSWKQRRREPPEASDAHH